MKELLVMYISVSDRKMSISIQSLQRVIIL